jgi:hypothetical protein
MQLMQYMRVVVWKLITFQEPCARLNSHGPTRQPLCRCLRPRSCASLSRTHLFRNKFAVVPDILWLRWLQQVHLRSGLSCRRGALCYACPCSSGLVWLDFFQMIAQLRADPNRTRIQSNIYNQQTTIIFAIIKLRPSPVRPSPATPCVCSALQRGTVVHTREPFVSADASAAGRKTTSSHITRARPISG